MKTQFNEDNTGGVLSTKDGPVTFTIDGNEVSVRETKTSHRLDGLMGLQSMTFQYLYNEKNNEKFNKWNPGRLADDIFIMNEEHDLIGIYLEVIDREDDDNSHAIEIYRRNVGELMEILFILGSLGEDLCDSEDRSYKFATLIGVSDVFDRYTKLLQKPDHEASLNYLMYMAGKVRGCCEMLADDASGICDVLNEVTLAMVVGEI